MQEQESILFAYTNYSAQLGFLVLFHQWPTRFSIEVLTYLKDPRKKITANHLYYFNFPETIAFSNEAIQGLRKKIHLDPKYFFL